ncbi:hypothetical protein [Roseibium sp. Sym1]|uniref:hypothetical protein n=1 Tax=Roseibium sp. Sym1 TaxID=3016006 RepID=UPI0022B3444E|nr:hypothetical protein [Roseibium sp. Sym1]
MSEDDHPPEPVKSVRLASGSATAELTSVDIQLMETAVEILIYADIEEGEQAREMRHVGKELHALMERLSPLLEDD